MLRIAGKLLKMNISGDPKISRWNLSYNWTWKIFRTQQLKSTIPVCSVQTPSDAVTISAESWPTRRKDPNACNVFLRNFKHKIFKNDPGNFDRKITTPRNVCKILQDETTWYSCRLEFPTTQHWELRFLINFITNTRVGTLIVANIYLQLIQNRYMFRSFTLLHCSHQHCVQPVASDVEVVGYL